MVKSWLEKRGIIQYIHFDFQFNKGDFVENLNLHIDNLPMKYFNQFSYFFKNRQNRLLGELNNQGFRLRFYSTNIGASHNFSPIAVGSFSEKEGYLKIAVKIGYPSILFVFPVSWFLALTIFFLYQTIFHGTEKILVLSIFVPLFIGFGYFIVGWIKHQKTYTDELREFIQNLFRDIEKQFE